MSDLSITAANVLPGSNALITPGTAGATITAGQLVYLDSATGTFKLADANSGTAAARSPYGIALNGASAGQPLDVLRSGDITIGATLSAGGSYYCSGTAGGIAPAADVTTGWYPTFVGIARSASVLRVNLTEAGVAL